MGKSNRMERRVQSFKDKGSALKISDNLSERADWNLRWDPWQSVFSSAESKDIQTLTKSLTGRRK